MAATGDWALWKTPLEGANSVGLQPMSFPDALDTGWTQTYHLRQASRAPMCGAQWFLLQRPVYHFTHLGFLDPSLAPRSTPVLEQTGYPISLIPIAPPADRWSASAQPPHDLCGGYAIRTEQYDTRPKNHLLRCIPIPYHLAQMHPILLVDHYSLAGSHNQEYIITNAI